MKKVLLIEFIRHSILEESKKLLHLHAQNKADITYAIGWLRLNKLLINASQAKLSPSGQYVAQVRVKGAKQKAINVVKDRFGSFVTVT